MVVITLSPSQISYLAEPEREALMDPSLATEPFTFIVSSPVLMVPLTRLPGRSEKCKVNTPSKSPLNEPEAVIGWSRLTSFSSGSGSVIVSGSAVSLVSAGA